MSPPRVPKSNSVAFVRALGAAVRARRLRLKQTCADLARRSGLSEAAIVQVEAGDPGLDLLQLVAIAEALEIPLRTLLQRAEKRIRWAAGNGGRTAPGAGSGRKGKGRAR
jgi:transcriptional regulator with XRE-family HTH domain